MCGHLLQMSHVAWSVCLYVGCAHGWAVQKRLNRSRCRLGWADSCGSKEPCIRWESRSPVERALLRQDMCWPIGTYLHMSALCIVCLPPRANVPASACGGRMHSPMWLMTNRRYALLPNYFWLFSATLFRLICCICWVWSAWLFSHFTRALNYCQLLVKKRHTYDLGESSTTWYCSSNQHHH